MNKPYKDFFIEAPWGKIALAIWGDQALEPVLMVHGRQDTAATFQLLVNHMADSRCYVAVDLPGNGKSDPYPKGLAMPRYYYIGVIEIVVKHMKWKRFVYLAHSLGGEFGLFYNALHPGVISKVVLLDAGPSFQRLQQQKDEAFYKYFYHRYYSQYERYNGPTRVYTKEQALNAIMKARQLTPEQAEIILSRALVPVGPDKFRLSWDPRVRYIVPPNAPNELYIYLFTKNSPPSLLISMSEGSKGETAGHEGAEVLIEKMVQNGLKRIHLKGGHDYHVTNAAVVAEIVERFLSGGVVRSKM